MNLDRPFKFLLREHNTCFYESTKNKHDILFSNLVAGWHNACSLLYISSGEDIENVRGELSDYGLRVDDPGRLKIVKSRDWYMPDGVFDPKRVVEQIRGLVDESLDRGLNGLCISADAADLFDYLSGNLELLLSLENSVGRVFKIPAEAVCAFRLNQALSNSEVFLQLVGAHKNTVTPSGLVNNRIACFRTMINVFNSIFGEQVTRTFFSHLERQLRIHFDQLPDQMESFEKMLEQVYDEGSANMIMDRIAREFIRKELKIGRFGLAKEESLARAEYYWSEDLNIVR